MRIVTMMLVAVISVSCMAQQPDAPKPKDKPEDGSDWLSFVLAGQAGGGFQPSAGPNAYAGVKIGDSLTLDLGFDRARSSNGFSLELSQMLPVLRYPRPSADRTKNYLRIYAEPGVGYRTGTGGYASAKMMFALLSDERIESYAKWSPYVEVQHRFPANGPLSNGDTRISFGLMYAICNHCSWD